MKCFGGVLFKSEVIVANKVLDLAVIVFQVYYYDRFPVVCFRN